MSKRSQEEKKEQTDNMTTLAEIYFTFFATFLLNLGSVGVSVILEILYTQLHVSMCYK